MLCEAQHIEAIPRLDHLPASLGPASSLVIRDRVDIRSSGGREELYDLSRDELETVDLARDPQYKREIDQLREGLGRLLPDLAITLRGGY